jgi:hypothetical protein
MSDGAHSHPSLESQIAALAASVDALTVAVAGLEGQDSAFTALIAALDARVTALETPPASFPIAWWAMSTEASIAAHVAAGFTHNMIFNSGVTVDYLDLLHAHGVKAITVMKPEFAGHPAIVAACVAEEPDDVLTGGVPVRTPAAVGQAAAAARAIEPGIPCLANLGVSLAAGPVDFATGETTPPGYWSLQAGPFHSPTGDARYGDHQDGYAGQVDIVCVQTFTAAGDPLTPKFRRWLTANQSTTPDLTPVQAGVRHTGFVEAGLRRARRLCGERVELWGLLAACKMRSTFGRHPTGDELEVETAGMLAAGATGLLWFDRGGDAGMPSEALLASPGQTAVITDINADIQEAYA